MTQLLVLLTLALQLLISANQPNVPESLKKTAISTANFAIQVANKAVAEANTPTPSSTPSPAPLGAFLQPSPSVSPIVSPSSVPSPSLEPIPTFIPNPIVMPSQSTPEIDKSDILVKLYNYAPSDEITGMNNGFKYGEWIYSVSVLDKQGKYVRDIAITMEASDNLYSSKEDTVRKPNGMTKDELQDWTASFVYHPLSSGHKTLTFTAGKISKTVEIDVK